MFLGQFTTRCVDYIFFPKGVDNFEIEHETCYFLVRGAVPTYRNLNSVILSQECDVQFKIEIKIFGTGYNYSFFVVHVSFFKRFQ